MSMRRITSIVMVICGALVVAGIFLDWGAGQSGWGIMTDPWTESIRYFTIPIFMLIGGILVILCSGLVLIGKGSLRTLRTLEVVSLVGATLAAGPVLFSVIAAGVDGGYGLYMATAGAVIGVIVGALAATRITRKKALAE